MNSSEVCRTCLLSGVPMFPLFDPTGQSGYSSVVELLKLLTGFQILQNDGFPGNICMACLDDVRRLNAFKMKCDSSQDFLIRLAGSFHSSNEVSVAACSDTNEEVLCAKDEVTNGNIDDTITTDSSRGSRIMFYEGYIIEELSEDEMNEWDENHRQDDIPSMDSGYNGHSNEVVDEPGYGEECSEPYQCSSCLYFFSTFGALKSHFSKEHRDEMLCNICNKEARISLWQHCLGHMPRLQECPECSATFIQKKYLTEHLKIHERERRLTRCSGCKKAFDMDCVRHKCEICSASFTRKHFLKEHQRTIHNFILPYQCPSCPTGFYRKFNLIRHVKYVHDKKKES